MNHHPSLSLRIILYLVISQFAAYFLGWAITLGLGLAGVEGFTSSWDELAANRVGKLVIASLKRNTDGHVEIDPVPELREEMNRTPALKYAAFDFATKEHVPGSSPQLVAALHDVVELSSTHAHFILPGDQEAPPVGFMEPKRTPFGRFHIATYRQKFRSDDIVYSIKENFSWVFAYVVAGVFLSVSAASMAVTRALSPVRVAIGQAAQIDLDSLDQRLPSSGVPAEIVPLVDAVNAALTRLDAGVARQRRFTANAAHELRTPLAIMRARLENAGASALRNELLSDASQMRSIVEELLVAARLTAGQLKLDQQVDLKQAVAQTVSAMMPLAMDRDRFIDFEAEASDSLVAGNLRAIQCVLTNLLDNALRAEPKHGSVLVRVSKGTLAVIDHGGGIAPQDRDAIFEPFWRKSDVTPGAGLGLAIAKEIIDAHRGRIFIEETAGGGATFKLEFKTVDRVFEREERS